MNGGSSCPSIATVRRMEQRAEYPEDLIDTVLDPQSANVMAPVES